MTTQVRGEFEVKMSPQANDPALGDVPARFGLEKRFHGALAADSRGQMLAFRSAIDGSAGYVAMELVDGAREGRRGTFVLQHSGTMRRGQPHLALAVVPDSGSGGLTGLRGTMAIEIIDGKHLYRFDYVFDSE